MQNIKFKGHKNATSIARNLILTSSKFKWDFGAVLKYSPDRTGPSSLPFVRHDKSERSLSPSAATHSLGKLGEWEPRMALLRFFPR
jgi:hypothetical protein